MGERGRQGVFLDDFKDARGREHGTVLLIGQLEQALARQSKPPTAT